MRFVIVLALLYYCSAFEQTTSATQQEVRLPPQHIKDFVEQPIPFLQQQIEEGKLKKVEVVKPKLNDQQGPENIKKFIELHITKVLQNFLQQKQQQKIQVVNKPSFDVPIFVEQKFQALKEDIKNIIKQAETHIPQVINQQIAYKNKLKEKQQIESNKISIIPEVIRQKAKTSAITDNIQKKPKSGKEDQQHKLQAVTQYVDKPTVLLLVKDVLKPANPHEAQYGAEVEKKEMPEKPLVVSTQIQPNIPQVIRQYIGDDNDKRKTDDTVILSGIQSVVEQIQQHVPHAIKQITTMPETKDSQNQSKVPEPIQGIVEQNHVPQVIGQKIALSNEKGSHDQPTIPDHIQGIFQQVRQHVPQTLIQHAGQVNNISSQNQIKVPKNIQSISELFPKHDPHIITEQKTSAKDIGGSTMVPGHLQHAQVDKRTNQVQSNIPEHIQVIVEQIHQTDAHVLDEHKTKFNGIEENSIIPEHIQGTVEHIHQHVAEVIKQEAAIGDKNANQEQPNIQEQVEQVHQHVPQIINKPINGVKVKEASENSAVPVHIQGIIEQIHQHIPQVISHHNVLVGDQNEQRRSTKPANIAGVVQLIDLQIPQVINRGEDHIAQEQNYYFVPNQKVAHLISPEYVVPQIPTKTVNFQSGVLNEGHINPVVAIVNKLTHDAQYEPVNNTNIVPSHVQQVQKEYHTSPVRTT